MRQDARDRISAPLQRYAELHSVRDLKAELDAAGIVGKARKAQDGTSYGSKSLARGALYEMLSNRIYRGEITHKGATHPGEHKSIIDETLWSEVQGRLTQNRVNRQTGSGNAEASLLTGIAVDAAGEVLTPTFAVKRGTRYRYYVSRPLIMGSKDSAGQRLPAPALESIVRQAIGENLADPATMLNALHLLHPSADAQRRLQDAVAAKVQRWDALTGTELRNVVLSFVSCVQVHADSIAITVDPDRLAAWLNGVPSQRADGVEPVTWMIPVQMKRRGNELRLVIDDGANEIAPNLGLIRLVAVAHHIRDRLLHDRASIDDVAREQGITPSYVTRALRIAFLAPDIVAALISGRHNPDLSARKIMADTRFPIDWAGQRSVFRIG